MGVETGSFFVGTFGASVDCWSYQFVAVVTHWGTQKGRNVIHRIPLKKEGIRDEQGYCTARGL